MNCRDIMSTFLLTLAPECSVKEAARLLVKSRISGAPVIDHAGKLLGIVSEGDLVRRTEIGTQKRGSWWLELLASDRSRAVDFVKSHAARVEDIMTRDVVTATADTSIDIAADLLEKHRVKRLPILEDGELVGIVTRADIVRQVAFAPAIDVMHAGDRELRDAVLNKFRALPWRLSSLVNASARDNTVDLWGMAGSDDEIRAIKIAAESAPGVKRVVSHLFVEPPGVGI
ncbi:CBS domain-containing protein [Terrarubrum flagellatum]|uniref:CBS domain-containing protein n=1 Tax=Terrirubrum flagellatum TaxID=2895980 RepID=UPI0031454EDD